MFNRTQWIKKILTHKYTEAIKIQQDISLITRNKDNEDSFFEKEETFSTS